MIKKSKILLSAILLLSTVPYFSAHAENDQNDKFSSYIQEAINEELALHNIQGFNTGINSLSKKQLNNELSERVQDPTLLENILKLENAEVTILEFDDFGGMVSAESSKRGEIMDDFVKETKKPIEEQVSNEAVTIQATPNLPSGGFQLTNNSPGDGAFHRLATPASTSATNYSGAVADSVRFPAYDIANANSFGEAGYMYTGLDGAEGYAEVGFGTASSTVGSYPTAWFPLFHGAVKFGPVKDTGPGSSPDDFWYDINKPYYAGQTVSGYKVYYKTNESVLTIRYQIGYSDLFIVRYPGINPSTGIKVKRLTTIGVPKTYPADSAPKVSWTTEANWGNYRFLTNNGAATIYPGEVVNLSDQTCLHGAKIYYLKNVISSTDRNESYWIYN